MKLKIKKGTTEIELEGDSYELREALIVLEPEFERLFSEPQAEIKTATENNIAEITADDIYYIFTRRPLSDAQHEFLQAVYNAGESGILASEVIAQSDHINSKSALAGVLGGLGRRVSHSFKDRGYPFGLFEDILDWVDERGENRYTLVEPAREAMARVELLG